MKLPRLGPVAWASLGVAVAFLFLYGVTPGYRLPPGSDAFYSWLIARSLAFDGDVHFANDYALCGDPFGMNRDGGGGRPSNPFYLGPALLWTPVLWLASWVWPFGAEAGARIRLACEGPLPRFVLFVTPLWSALTLFLGGRVALRFVDETKAAWAVVLTGLATAFVHFATVNAAYSHAYAALGVGLTLWGSHWADERDDGRARAALRWAPAGMACGAAGVMRTQGLCFLLLPALLLFPGFVDELRRRRVPVQALLRGGTVLAACGAVFSIQLAYNLVIYGQPMVVTQGEGYLMLGRPRLAALLWGGRGGLFAWHPILYLSALGGLLLLWRAPKWGWALFLPVALDTWVDASVSDWHGAATFGARRMVAHAPIWVVSMAVGLRSLAERCHARDLRWALPVVLAAGLILVNVGASSGNPMHRTPFKRSVRPSELWSIGLAVSLEAVEEVLGNPFSLPASLPFALRYQLHPKQWDRFTSGGVYVRYFTKPSRIGSNHLAIGGEGGPGQRFDGFGGTAGAALLDPGQTGRAMLELHWPIATQLAITGRALGSESATVFVRSYGPLFGRGEVELTLDEKPSSVLVELPEGFVDAGVNELWFETEARVELRTLKLFDRAWPRIP